MGLLTISLFLVAAMGFDDQPADAVKQEIHATYDKMIASLQRAKSIEDLDAMHRAYDTPDWVSIVPNRPPTTWQEMRKLPFESLSARFDSMTLRIVSFALNGETAVLVGELRVEARGGAMLVPIKETWVKTPSGWKRKIHEKTGPGRALRPPNVRKPQ